MSSSVSLSLLSDSKPLVNKEKFGNTAIIVWGSGNFWQEFHVLYTLEIILF